jgi:hypothetical protein
MSVQDFFSNGWIVGIGTGAISGLIGTLLSKWILSRRDNGEYSMRITNANKEAVASLRPIVSDGTIPQKGTIDAVISSTARKHGVAVEDMYSRRNVLEDLTKEVIDSSFI